MLQRVTNLTKRVAQVIAGARDEAYVHRHAEVDTGHLLYALLKDGQGVAVDTLKLTLQPSKFTVEQVLSDLRQRLTRIRGSSSLLAEDIPLNEHATKALECAIGGAQLASSGYVNSEHLLLGLLLAHGMAREVLNLFHVVFKDIHPKVQGFLIATASPE